ncbi:YcaO-like family protein [Streptomyces spinoverrucosus]|uniref:YcaO-like family protein n=1 Tax=Streptomyces spinoverrucosus TaxID=284043 RepID=UPI0018C37A67|nr:YcaO-like family protein [Streptomyces spinoverrucosus]MBG0857021.1 YcaO-like family protein [Streptomyces spinoverrucosus]
MVPGLIERVTRDRPRVETVPSCVSYSAHLSARPEFAPWVVDTVTGGAALGDHDKAREAAMGEAVERYCGNAVPPTLPIASYGQLARAGRPAIDPREFALYAPSQYARRGFPFVAMTRDLEIAWISGTDLTDGAEVLVPASLAYVNYFRGPHSTEPPTNYPLLAGTAAGTDPEQARRAALEEVLERDAVTVWWLSGAQAAALAPEPGGPVAAAVGEARSAGLEVTFLRIPSTFDITVVGAFIEDPGRQLVAFGSACRSTAEDAAAKALTEAVGMHETGLELLDGDGDFWTGVRTGRHGHRPYRPYRGDRAYRDDFRPDLRDINDVRLHVQLWLDPRMHDSRLDRLRAPGIPGPVPPDDTTGTGAVSGLRVITVDLTTPQARAAGLHVARVLVPGLSCNAPAAFPFLGGRRLYEEPAARGWVPGPLGESDLMLDPLPFS